LVISVWLVVVKVVMWTPRMWSNCSWTVYRLELIT